MPDDDKPQTIALTHQQHGLVICNVEDVDTWKSQGYVDKKMVKPKRVKAAVSVADLEVDVSDDGETKL